ncbi:MAG: Glutamyl-tRNA(Gln) amidotransferase subunit E [Candidatus Methanogaster sp.]|nr:MAG: Glutamyl-tRNA(Gln) amidotransferase subunit E [ANME-2 cluster archaeon]
MTSTPNLDYETLGLKAGLEIHQQLNTEHKLFCRCPTLLRDTSESDYEFYRYLRPTQSEMGETDRAALEEAKVIRKFRYKAYPSTCLVENDEEPPRELNEDAIDITLMITRLLHMQPVDELHTMRKIVIDGSNTAGFQRTSLAATDGYLETSEGKVGVDVLCLEEDAAQRVGEEADTVVFSLDRLGIPLVEIGTAPDIVSPAHARETAEQIGMILRSTGAVKRGIGTIRQDVNISIAEGARVEIKGVQELDLIETIVMYEALRQVRLLEIKEELKKRGATVGETMDVTHIFENTKSAVIKRAIENGCVLALHLRGFGGLVGAEIQPDRRLGSEFSDRAKKAGVGGIFHTDELPAYGVTGAEVGALRDFVGAEAEDCVAIVADLRDRAAAAIGAVSERAEQALIGVPEETRKMLPDGISAYLRPLPGAARMYPETDVPPVPISGRIEDILVPELLSDKKDRYVREYNLSEDLARKIVYSRHLTVFDAVMGSVSVDAALVVRTLTATLTELRKDGIRIGEFSDRHFLELFGLVADNAIAKEGIIEILRVLADQPGSSVADVAESIGIVGMDEVEIVDTIARIVMDRSDFVRERGMGAVGPLMGIAMQNLRGKADGKLISRILTEKIREELA